MDAHEKWRLENLRRSIAMLGPGQQALDRERALELIEQLQTTTRELEHVGTDPNAAGSAEAERSSLCEHGSAEAERTGTGPSGGAATRLPGIDDR